MKLRINLFVFIQRIKLEIYWLKQFWKMTITAWNMRDEFMKNIEIELNKIITLDNKKK